MIIFKLFIKDNEFKNIRSYGLKGNIILYLDNNNTIKLIDRNIRELINNTQYSIYYLTDGEIETLKNTNIKIIKYNIYNKYNKLSTRTMKNSDLECEIKKYSPDLPLPTTEKKVFERVNFPKIISNFF